MIKFWKNLILNTLIIFSTIILIGCNSTNTLENEFGLEQFENEMKSKGYSYTLQNIEPFFSSTETKTMKLNGNLDNIIEIYIYKNNIQMEENAKCITPDGSGFSKGKESMQIDWKSTPHFYKKGNIIVNYIGEDKKINSDLKTIFGEQFAGR